MPQDRVASGDPSLSGPQRRRRGLDEVDRALLRALDEDATRTVRALAARVGVPESTCAYRLRSLRRDGVVSAPRVEFDLAALGYGLEAMVRVRLGRHDEAHVARFLRHLTEVPGVVRVYHVAGVDDFHVHVAVEDADALRTLLLRHVTADPAVTHTETHLLFESRPGSALVR